MKLLRLTLLLLFIHCSLNGQAQKILFVGNSLTYFNEMPKMIESIGQSFEKEIITLCMCKPNYGLEDHWNDGKIESILDQGNFDYIIIQQGPSSQPNGRVSLTKYGELFSALAKEHTTELAFYMVWPSIRYYHTFSGVVKNYSDAAMASDALLVPVGQLWRSYREKGLKPNLYGADGFHPSIEGSFFTALIHFKKLFDTNDLSSLKYSDYKNWIKQKSDFETIISFLENKIE